MFLKNLTINLGGKDIRSVDFHIGVNLIVDRTGKGETVADSGNNVGKTTLLKIVDFCLGASAAIIRDSDAKDLNAENSKFIKELERGDPWFTLTLSNFAEGDGREEHVLKRRYLSQKVERGPFGSIDGVSYSSRGFLKRLKEIIYKKDAGRDTESKPTFRQLLSRSVRIEGGALNATLQTLHAATKGAEYETLHLAWLGIETPTFDKKKALQEKAQLERVRKHLLMAGEESFLQQTLLAKEEEIEILGEQREHFMRDPTLTQDAENLERIRQDMADVVAQKTIMEFELDLGRRNIEDLRSKHSDIDVQRLRGIYSEATQLLGEVSKTFEQALQYHNAMIDERIRFASRDIPRLEGDVQQLKEKVKKLQHEEAELEEKLKRLGILQSLEVVVEKLNMAHEEKAKIEERIATISDTEVQIRALDKAINAYNAEIDSVNPIIQERLRQLNAYFSSISEQLYEIKEIVSTVTKNAYLLLSIDPMRTESAGTGRKKQQMVAFDMAYILFARDNNIPCPQFMLYDQMESIDDVQLRIIADLVKKHGVQFIVPILADKLPYDLNRKENVVLTLSQRDRLFKI